MYLFIYFVGISNDIPSFYLFYARFMLSSLISSLLSSSIFSSSFSSYLQRSIYLLSISYLHISFISCLFSNDIGFQLLLNIDLCTFIYLLFFISSSSLLHSSSSLSFIHLFFISFILFYSSILSLSFSFIFTLLKIFKIFKKKKKKILSFFSSLLSSLLEVILRNLFFYLFSPHSHLILMLLLGNETDQYGNY